MFHHMSLWFHVFTILFYWMLVYDWIYFLLLYYIISYCFWSCHIILHYIILHNITSYHITLYSIILYVYIYIKYIIASTIYLSPYLCYEATSPAGPHLRPGMQFCYDEMLTNPHQQQLLQPAKGDLGTKNLVADVTLKQDGVVKIATLWSTYKKLRKIIFFIGQSTINGHVQ